MQNLVAIFLCYLMSKIIAYEMKINEVVLLTQKSEWNNKFKKNNNNEQVIVVLFQHHWISNFKNTQKPNDTIYNIKFFLQKKKYITLIFFDVQ
jgi:hypothetical protein